jgi:hypothetical protein
LIEPVLVTGKLSVFIPKHRNRYSVSVIPQTIYIMLCIGFIIINERKRNC